ncbi:MAG: chemotaxis protein CheA [Chloroflexota bacterium]|nr:chemotaxis protein CheA [Chloroflexota bacterium]
MKKRHGPVKSNASLQLAPDITEEELQVFLQEAEEQLQLLDQDIIKLEKGEEDANVLQEIFRAAHTLKGSSAMLGHTRMAELTHAMESVLDRLRKGTMTVSTEVVDALLRSLDVLKSLKDELLKMEISSTDMTSVVVELDRLDRIEQSKEAASTESRATKTHIKLVLNDDERKKVSIALTEGQKVYKVEVTAVEACEWAQIRLFQVLHAVSQSGSVVTSVPTQAEIENQQCDYDLAFIVITEHDAQVIHDEIMQIDDLAQVVVSVYELVDSDVVKDMAQSAVKTSSSERASSLVGAASKEMVGQVKPISNEARASQTVRIDVQRLDDLMNLIGELAISRTRIHQIGKLLESKYKDDEMVKALSETSTNSLKIVDQLQESMMKVRMLPISTVFGSFPRMVRDLARRAGKDVDFVVEGQETEIDRTVIERIRDPLVHLLRNAVDHGVESVAERNAADKPQRATIHLSAYQEESHIVIVVEDDGAGIDPYRVRDEAVKKGIISLELASRLSQEEAIDLIFASGMSTSENTTEVSGRGVGMDIVRRNIQALNGVVLIDTKPGIGTKFTLKLPLTLATFEGLLVSSAGTVYAIPLISVTETLKLESGSTRTVEGREIVRLRDEILPLVRLRKTLYYDEGCSNESFVVVTRDASRPVGLAVDSVMEPQEVVVKPISSYLGDVKGVAGASILGDGRVALILDVPTLVRTTLDVRNIVI